MPKEHSVSRQALMAGLTPGVPLTLRVTPGHQGEDPFEVQVSWCKLNPC